jgi:hypothetical protein
MSKTTLAIPSAVRLLHYGIGRGAFATHALLSRLGLVDVEWAESRHLDGKVEVYNETQEAHLHRIKLLPSGLEEPAVPTLKATLTRRLNG